MHKFKNESGQYDPITLLIVLVIIVILIFVLLRVA
jgi:hypothetical protein